MIPAQIPAGCIEKLKSARKRVLLIDYDGTLAPFKVERMQARPLPQAMAALKKIIARGNTRVVVISGRKIQELRKLLDDLPVVMVGEHGWVKWESGKEKMLREPSESPRHILAKLRKELSKDLDRTKIEVKRTSVAVHTRGLPDDRAQRVIRKVERAASGLDPQKWHVQYFNRGIELRAAGMDKGKAVKSLTGDARADSLIVYLGDDVTDEDAFKAIRKKGIGIKVGRPETRTYARYWVRDCAAVAQLLKVWQKQTA